MTPVLIAGAGPTGLVLALWLTRLGVKVRIIDKTAEPGTTSRACDPGGPDPKVRHDEADPVLDHGRREVDLPVELEGTRLHRERARGGTGLRGLVDDPDLH